MMAGGGAIAIGGIVLAVINSKRRSAILPSVEAHADARRRRDASVGWRF